MIKAVLFDIDGTLLDSVEFHAQAWVDILTRHGREVTIEQMRKQIGKGGDQLLPEYFTKEELDDQQEAIEKERSAYFTETYLPRVKPFPKVRDLFERILADGKRIALASSGNKAEVEKYEKIAGIDDLIDAKTSSDDAERSKPEPDIFHAAIKKVKNVDVSEMIAIGDTPYDAIAAGKAGLRTIGLLCGGFEEHELLEAGCVAIYKDPADLLARYDDSPIVIS